ncbi:hypothetical protein [Neobacillus cucumis]|uniref:hypothetical protein n=1 Tax=Neobacillus cucumis TaxID=1740721 RepID=UPI00196265A6|nr:hypothetical protein [Neobacillus cucumis]MBM7650973.1 hypothetical protein [Neobacillus cucumis]MED4226737.1 hypothetical protein [Neobacillus cucumis]
MMMIILGILGLLITLLVIATILSIETQLKKLNRTNDKIVELLTEIKKDQLK